MKSLSRVRLFTTPWTVAYQAPPIPSMGFSRQECWSGLPFPSPGDLPDPGIEPGSPALQADALLSEPPGKVMPDWLGPSWCLGNCTDRNLIWSFLCRLEALHRSFPSILTSAKCTHLPNRVTCQGPPSPLWFLLDKSECTNHQLIDQPAPPSLIVVLQKPYWGGGGRLKPAHKWGPQCKREPGWMRYSLGVRRPRFLFRVHSTNGVPLGESHQLSKASVSSYRDWD